MRVLLVGFLTMTLAFPVQAKVIGKAVEYRHDGAVYVGYLAYEETVSAARPGVLVVHEWWGLNDFAKEQVEKLAQMGYVALAADMYGKGVVTNDRKEAARLAGEVRGTPKMRERALAALKVLAGQPQVDSKRLAAMGFCFGGTAVLELAYAGADAKGVVSFHGGLTSPKPEDLQNLKAKFLVLHGADDPLVKPEEIAAFQDAMRKGGADWQMVYLGGAVHSFTSPGAGSDKSKGVAYDATAAARSFRYMRDFLAEIFGRP